MKNLIISIILFWIVACFVLCIGSSNEDKTQDNSEAITTLRNDLVVISHILESHADILDSTIKSLRNELTAKQAHFMEDFRRVIVRLDSIEAQYVRNTGIINMRHVGNDIWMFGILDEIPPGTPIGFEFHRTTLEWNANTEFDLDGYILFIFGDALVPQEIDVGNVTEFELGTLTVGATYSAQLVAYDLTGNESDPTDPLVFTVGAKQ